MEDVDFIWRASEDFDNRTRIVSSGFDYVDTLVDNYLCIAHIIRWGNCWKERNVYAERLRGHSSASADSAVIRVSDEMKRRGNGTHTLSSELQVKAE